jgi:hypothetical protein
MTVHPGHLVKFSADGIGSVTVLYDEAPPQVTGGYGGWDVVARPHRKALTQYVGVDPIGMSIPILFDGFADGNGQEIEISRLSRMALPHGDDEPPIVEVEGRGFPQPGPRRWVIAGLDWGQNVIRGVNDSGTLVRLRQDCVVNLLEYVAEDRTAFSRAGGAQPGGGAWPKHYVWRRGDTLQKVSSNFYHTPKKWKKIATANNIRDPKNIKVGKVLIIPKP